jgi:hypothetical protein
MYARTIQTTIAPNGVACSKGHGLVRTAGDQVGVGGRLFGGTVEMALPLIQTVLINYPSGTDIFSVINTLNKDPSVVFAEPDYVVQGASIPNDPLWSRQYGPQKIGCPAAWDIGNGDRDTVIAILDSGISHSYGSAFEAEFNVGPGAKVGGTLEMKLAPSVPITLGVWLFNFRTNTWERGFLLRTALDAAETSLRIPLPRDPQDYVSETHQFGVKLVTSAMAPHELRTDLLRLRLIGY